MITSSKVNQASYSTYIKKSANSIGKLLEANTLEVEFTLCSYSNCFFIASNSLLSSASFYDYVNNHVINSDFTRQIDDEISYLKLDSKVRREFMLLEARLLDERREAKAEGLAEGKAKEKTATAKRLLSMGLSVGDIAKATSLSIEQVEAIKAE